MNILYLEACFGIRELEQTLSTVQSCKQSYKHCHNITDAAMEAQEWK